MKPYRIPQLAKPYIDYDMIQRHTELPPFSDGRSHLLYIFLNRGASAEPQRGELYTLVTALAQLGLDTHEEIDRNAGEPGGDVMRTRQLKVLAGDYFSSWFYHLLSKRGEVEIVGTLSQAIAEFNIMKARLYCLIQSRDISAEQYLRYKAQLNRVLFLSFTPRIEASLISLWEKLLAEVSLCEALVREIRISNDPSEALDGYCYWRILESATEEEVRELQDRAMEDKDWKKLIMKYKCNSLLTDKLHQSVQSIQGLLQEVKDEKLLSELNTLLSLFLRQIEIPGQAAVEG